jgi:predicted HD phosphohydrolase
MNKVTDASIADIASLFDSRGQIAYYEHPLTHLQHALQCAQLAEHYGASPDLVQACLLHDVGHLLVPQEIFDHQFNGHEHTCVPFLRGVVSESVIGPIRLHVDAWRYLCAVDPVYRMSLSAHLAQRLQQVGGPFSLQQAAQFIAQPYARESVLLRRWDDLAIVPGQTTPSLHHYLRMLESSIA